MYLENGVVRNNFTYGYTPNSKSRKTCIGSYKGKTLPNPYKLLLGDETKHDLIGKNVLLNEAEIYDGYLCYTIPSNYTSALL